MDSIIYTGDIVNDMAELAYTVSAPAGGKPNGLIELLSRIFHRK